MSQSPASAETDPRDDDPQGEGVALDSDGLAALRKAVSDWREGPVARAQARMPQRAERLTTWSGLEVPDVLTPVDQNGTYPDELGLPGEYPFTRGVQPTMYRNRLWTMRMLSAPGRFYGGRWHAFENRCSRGSALC